MELINPKLTVQNTDKHFWLVRLEHAVSAAEHIDVQLKVQRSQVPVHELQAQLMRQTVALLQAMLDKTGTPAAG
jgi:hypothetical protein